MFLRNSESDCEKKSKLILSYLVVLNIKFVN